ncbi:MAG: hypothetical protein ACRDK4_15900, partial [Solirubrobacteraceae bacterium]
RYLADTGRVFFNSRDALVPRDVNGTWDVYEYEPPGVGGCTAASSSYSERSGGCVNLISSGAAAEESGFLDASATGGRDAEEHEGGGDVFFLTAAKLVTGDRDSALDVYDAHECTTASPCLPQAQATPPACETEASCRPAPSPQPAIFGAPASATVSGPDNLSPTLPAGHAKPKTKRLTRAQRLARALKACHKQKRHARRVACQRRAHKHYGAKSASKRGKR